MIKKLKAALDVSVPLVSIETEDPALCITSIRKALNGKVIPLQWDICTGLYEFEDDPNSGALAQEINGELRPTNCTDVLGLMRAKMRELGKMKDGKRMICFMHQMHRGINADGVSQAIWNLRDLFKRLGHMLILLSPGMKLPDELKQDVVVLSEDLPDKAAITEIVTKISGEAIAELTKGKWVLTPQLAETCADTLSGLSGFGVEQTFAMCLTSRGPDLKALWDSKCKAIEQTDGASVFKGRETFADLGGCENVKFYGRKIMEGRKSPIAILWLDELEKSLAGARGDTSGTSQDQLGYLLTCMQDWDLPGLLLLGHPGTAKSAFVKALGGEFERPVVRGDLGAAKGSLVGESERKIRALMNRYRAICNGQGLVVATCNKIDALPPELRRRFYLGVFMFDTPSTEEQELILPIWLRKCEITDQQNDVNLKMLAGWTGAEIRAMCECSYRTGMKLSESMQFITPICKSAADQVEALRNLAHNRFISANKPGVYQKPTQATGPSRLMNVS